jgi:hypothetical protein
VGDGEEWEYGDNDLLNQRSTWRENVVGDVDHSLGWCVLDVSLVIWWSAGDVKPLDFLIKLYPPAGTPQLRNQMLLRGQNVWAILGLVGGGT